MWFVELGKRIRAARASKGTTQAELGYQANLTRTTVNQLEAGVCPDLGIKKVIRLLAALGLEIDVIPRRRRKQTDYLHMACVSANVAFRERLTPDELASIILTAKLPENRRPHLRHIFEETPPRVVQGMVEQLSAAVPKPERVLNNLRTLATCLGSKLELPA